MALPEAGPLSDPGSAPRRLSGWRLAALAALLGAIATAALPPFHLVFLLVPAFAGLLWSIEGGGFGRAFAAGWWFGLGHFSTGLYWMANALLIEPERFAWMVPFAVLGLPAVLGVFTGAAAAAARVARGGVVGRVLVFAAAWTVLEWVRSWVLTGLPWNLIGTVWADTPAMIQGAAFVGTYGLSLVTVAGLAMPAVLLGKRGGRLRIRQARSWAWAASALALLVVVGAVAAGREGPADGAFVPGVRLRLVQPAIAQDLKWQPEMRRRHVLDQIALATQPSGSAPPTHILWSEAAVPFFLEDEPELLRLVGEATPSQGLSLVGAPRGRFEPGRLAQVWNSLHAVDPQGRVVAIYDKTHLVPFGEYVPLRSVLPIDKLTQGRVDFSPGPGLKTLRLAGLPPVGPLICYEAVFPGRAVDPADRPDWLLNLTNDGWFGISTGPYQHFAAARMRAVEEGLPLVRVANTGISAVIDAYGRIVAKLELGRKGVLDSGLPRPAPGLTPYARHGNAIPLGMALALGLLGVLASRRNFGD